MEFVGNNKHLAHNKAINFAPSAPDARASRRLLRCWSLGFIGLILLVGVLALSGCSLMKIHNQTKLIDNLGTIKGKIRIANDQKDPIIVLRFLDEDGILVLKQGVIANGNGGYEFLVVAGKHYIAAFVDVNNDGKYQAEEHGNYYGDPSTIDVAPPKDRNS